MQARRNVGSASGSIQLPFKGSFREKDVEREESSTMVGWCQLSRSNGGLSLSLMRRAMQIIRGFRWPLTGAATSIVVIQNCRDWNGMNHGNFPGSITESTGLLSEGL